MTYIITETCIDEKDKSCVDVCPVDCIHEVDRMLVIDPDECIDCAACVPVCPVDAIFADYELPPEFEAFAGINAAWTDGAPEVDRLVAAWLTAKTAGAR